MNCRNPRAPMLLLGAVALALLGWTFVPIRAGAPAPSQAPTPSAAGKELTVERIYGEPSLNGSLTRAIEWRPDGRSLSYLQANSQGQDELWLLDAATGERRVLVGAEKLRAVLPPENEAPTQLTGLGRVTPERYFWAPGGNALLFVSKATLNWLDVRTQAVRTLVSGGHAFTDPKISPDDKWVSFARDSDLWAVNVATGETKALTEGGSEALHNGQLDWVYPEELDLHTAYWWSPDSKKIAYLQLDEHAVTNYPYFVSFTGEVHTERYPATGEANPIPRVGVVSATGGKTRWMDTGSDTNDYLARVAWLPESKRLAIERLNRAQTQLELLFADAGSGRAQIILTEEDKHWINLGDELYFFSNGQRFLWSSERSGYRHLSLHEISGKRLRQVTQGNWAVTALEGVDAERGLVYFQATEKSPLERHLYRIALDGSGLTRLSLQDGTHEIEMAPGLGAYVDTSSNAMTPPRQDLYRADGTRLAVINDNHVAELDEYHLSPVAFFTVPGADGTRLNAYMIKPPNFDRAHKYPVLVNVYGGPGAQVVLNSWGTSWQRFLWHEMMAQKGYIIFAVDNRGSTARGHDFETPIYHQLGKVELADQLAGVRFMRSLPYVDGSRIGIWGWSYGGYMTLQAMLEAGDAFKAGLAVAPVTDWRQYDTIYTERYMGMPEENPEGYQQASPVTFAGNLKGKLLIAHGTGDDNVKFANTLELAERFIQTGRYAEIMILPGRGHPISDTAARIELFRRATQFFLDNL